MKPSQEFTIKILDNDDFDLLPYPRAKEAAGMTVMATKTAYIRKTGVRALDQNTINHEFDELMQQTSPHEENGIRYKLWLAPLISWIASNAVPIAASAAASYGVNAISANQQNKAAEGLANKQNAEQERLVKLQASLNPVTNAFAPQTQTPLGQEDFNSSLSKISNNASRQQKSVMETFRGRTIEGDSAFSKALANTKTSSEAARNAFLADQKKLGSTLV